MPLITNLTGQRINELQLNPTLSDTTKIIIQNGTDVAEASTIGIVKAYLDIDYKISNSISNHLAAVDPHGDRAYSLSQLNLHKTELDPHGYKAYVGNEITIHTQSVDPHGDRSYTLALVNAHNAEPDPHGYKAYTTNAVTVHNLDVNAHNITDRIDTAIDDIRGVENGFAPLDTNLTIPQIYLPASTDKVLFVNTLPLTGVIGYLYVNYQDEKQYYWNGTTFKVLSSFNISGSNLTTDDVLESTVSDRRYFTNTRESTINTSINNRILTGLSLGTGVNVYKEKVGSTLNFRTLVEGTGITIVQDTNTLTIGLTPVSSVENEAIDFSLAARTYTGELTNYLTLDGLTLAIDRSNTIKYPQNGLTQYSGKIVVSKIKQGSNLEQIGKYNKVEETKVWQLDILIRSYTEWDIVDDPLIQGEIVSTTLTELHTVGITNTGVTLTASLDETYNALLLQCTSPNNANYVYLWKSTLKKTFIDFEETGTISNV